MQMLTQGRPGLSWISTRHNGPMMDPWHLLAVCPHLAGTLSPPGPPLPRCSPMNQQGTLPPPHLSQQGMGCLVLIKRVYFELP